jgi:hypothetical protein
VRGCSPEGVSVDPAAAAAVQSGRIQRPATQVNEGATCGDRSEGAVMPDFDTVTEFTYPSQVESPIDYCHHDVLTN